LLRAISNATSALLAQQQKLDVTAHNIANLNTTGFKKKELLFRDLIYQEIAGRGRAVVPTAENQKPVSSGTGVAMLAIRPDLSDGNYLETGRELDLAISGPGYFRVILPDGSEAYTRAGDFRKDSEGFLVTAQGYQLPLQQLPAEEHSLKITADGYVTAITAGGEIVDLGRLELAYFDNPAGLLNLGQNLFASSPASGPARIAPPQERTVIRQGYLENANVELSAEMTSLLTSQRNFALMSRSLRTFDEMMDIANNMRR